MVTSIETIVRPAKPQDRGRIANLIHFELRVHRNFDWKTPLDWLGDSPFLILERNNRIVAALACPPDPEKIGWIRLFAVHSSINTREAWQSLWPAAAEMLSQMEVPKLAAAITVHNWFRELLEGEGFQHHHDIVMLAWTPIELDDQPQLPGVFVRPMNYDDLRQVERIDHDAFFPLWRNSLEGLQTAFRQATFATVAEIGGNLVGYQISTSNSMGGHLARLAVSPEHQGRGIGYYLVHDVLQQFYRRGADQVTVNTQSNNRFSVKLYNKLGFVSTGEIFPVYEYPIE